MYGHFSCRSGNRKETVMDTSLMWHFIGLVLVATLMIVIIPGYFSHRPILVNLCSSLGLFVAMGAGFVYALVIYHQILLAKCTIEIVYQSKTNGEVTCIVPVGVKFKDGNWGGVKYDFPVRIQD
jgi:hypothetical protein